MTAAWWARELEQLQSEADRRDPQALGDQSEASRS